jgi:glycosyltransferase involved in cell wall biosynthesis
MLPKVVICNDYIRGVNGEEVLWSFLCDKIPNAIGVDSRLLKTSNTNPLLASLIKRHIDTLFPKPNRIIIIQNATFMGIVDANRHTIVYLQDDLRKMGRANHPNGRQQTQNLKTAHTRVSNSRITAKSYPEYKFEIIPIGVNHELFTPNRKPLTPPNKPVGIFVGALNEIKGWSEINRIIHQRRDIFFIIVSKYNDGKCLAPNSITYNCIDQSLLAQLLNSSNFFILGSPVETQCLAAMEACMCDVPVIMKPTGIFMDFSQSDRDRCGYFVEDLASHIDLVLQAPKTRFQPRNVMLEQDLTIDGMIRKWTRLLDSQQV